MFDIEDKIILYDLTNTYFEGRKQGSKLAKFGRSKEKRSDAKLVVLGLVINPEVFIKYLCMSRSGLKIYHIEVGATTVSVTNNQKQKIELCQVNSDRNMRRLYS